jgi:hypothetical protein
MSLVDSTGHALVPQSAQPHPSLEVLRWQAMQEFDAARIAMAQELPSITKDGKIQLRQGKPILFASFENVHNAVMPILHKFGFYVTFQGTEINGGEFWIRAFLRRSGCSVESLWPVDRKPVSPAMNPNQATGAGATYACRHALIRLLNLNSHAPEDRDTDAVVHEPAKPITAAQLKKLEASIGNDEELKLKIKTHFLDVLQIPGLDALPASELGSLTKAIATYKARQKS